MATHSSILAWRIPWTEEPGGLQSTESQRVGPDGSDLVCTYTHTHTHTHKHTHTMVKLEKNFKSAQRLGTRATRSRSPGLGKLMGPAAMGEINILQT